MICEKFFLKTARKFYVVSYIVMIAIIGLTSSTQAQAAPLSCGTNTTLHDWDINLWPGGSLAQSYSTNGENLNIIISGDTSYFLPDPTSAPVTSDYDTGGLSPAELSLELWLDFASLSESIAVTFEVGEAGIGVEELQFSIFDVDFNETQFQDEVTVTGSLNGNPVTPFLTASSSNTVSGNVGTGQVETPETSSNANLDILFDSPIDQFVITYSNGPLAPDPPGGQAISIHDISTCPRLLPEIIVAKSVSTYDPGNEGLYNIPGTEVVYTLTATNVGNGSTTSNSLFIKDSLPTEVSFFNGDFNGAALGTDSVVFTKTNAPSLSFDSATDLRFSDAASPPMNFSDCTYSASGSHDSQIKHVCLNPKGVFEHGDPSPSFSFQFRTLIK